MNALPEQPEHIVALAGRHGLTLQADSLRFEQSGADFLVVFASDETAAPWVLRLPRRPEVLPRAASEGRALALIAPRLQVAVPDWRVQSEELIAYPLLSGRPAEVEGAAYVWHVDEPPPHPLFVRTLGRTLAELHGISAEDVAAAGVPVHAPAEVRAMAASMLEQARAPLDASDRMWATWQRWLADDTYWPQHSALTHGDLHPGHMLLDNRGGLTGLLDWTEAAVSDPALDFTYTHASMGPAVLADVLEAYRQGGGRVWPRMADHIAMRWTTAPAMTAIFAQEPGNEGYLEFARSLLADIEQGLHAEA
jgi:macrolide phosphotransferase